MTDSSTSPGRHARLLLPDRLRALLQDWEVTQWSDRQALDRSQAQRLAALLGHTWQQVPFYRQRLLAVGYQPGRAVTPDLWQALPIMTRSEVQAAGTALRAQKLPPGHGRSVEVSTSGSTATPVTITKTGLAQLIWWAVTLREHHWQRRDVSRKLAAIRVFKDDRAKSPQGRLEGSWGPPTALVCSTGPAILLDVEVGLHRQLEWLAEQDPAYLLSLPSNLRALANLSLAQGVRLPGLRQVRCVGEPVDDDVRHACKAAWGVDVSDVYSSQELGYLALQCPHHDHYHVQEEVVRLEILHADGRPCGPGEVGQVVATPLYNFATPLLRYALGDYAQVGDRCPCGRGLAVLSKILGRERNMWVRPNGDRWWPQLGSGAMASFTSVRQWQIVQKSRQALEIRLVAPLPLDSAQEAALRTLAAQRLGEYFEVQLTYCNEIPRTPSGKFEDYICAITDA